MTASAFKPIATALTTKERYERLKKQNPQLDKLIDEFDLELRL